MTVQEAVEVLFAERHHLGPDVLRSLQGIWDCASAARYGEPYERWGYDPEFYAAHDTAECEDDAEGPICPACGGDWLGCECWKPGASRPATTAGACDDGWEDQQ